MTEIKNAQLDTKVDFFYYKALKSKQNINDVLTLVGF